MYSPQLLEHFQNPRNPGEVEQASATAELENPACGDILRLSARVEAGKIARLRFKAKGCVPAMACGSALTELAQGLQIAEARAITPADLERAVGGLPEASSHASALAVDTLRKLLNKLEGQSS
ncbi:MAG TPA: iron-sulfur cluster assembly scaffold protein [Terriglobales bacterium]|nr:iron-sulfur cluster assembly scaffold protein [Terriglobales bacterium]